MKTSLSDKYIKSRYTGLDIYQARKKILQDFPEFEERNIDIYYVESPYPRFTVLKSSYNTRKGMIELYASSNNPIRHLPSNYQTNDFLRGFLMIFQHIMNDTSITLDNMDEYFRPMESPVSFLPVLSNWLGIHLDMLGGEAEIRRFLQYAIPLYRYRGTALGLRAHLALLSGTAPAIIEGRIPYASMVITDNSEVETSLFDSEDEKNAFTVHFPVMKSRFEDTLIRRLALVIQREKPVHTKAYLSFEKNTKRQRDITVIGNETSMGTDRGISV
jgi:phage tail-like protein